MLFWNSLASSMRYQVSIKYGKMQASVLTKFIPFRLALCACTSVVSDSLQPLLPLPGASVHGILQARILDWVAMPISRGSSQPRDGTQVSYIASGFFTI